MYGEPRMPEREPRITKCVKVAFGGVPPPKTKNSQAQLPVPYGEPRLHQREPRISKCVKVPSERAARALKRAAGPPPP